MNTVDPWWDMGINPITGFVVPNQKTIHGHELKYQLDFKDRYKKHLKNTRQLQKHMDSIRNINIKRDGKVMISWGFKNPYGGYGDDYGVFEDHAAWQSYKIDMIYKGYKIIGILPIKLSAHPRNWKWKSFFSRHPDYIPKDDMAFALQRAKEHFPENAALIQFLQNDNFMGAKKVYLKNNKRLQNKTL